MLIPGVKSEPVSDSIEDDDTLHKRAIKAILSVNKFDITSPPRPLIFGEFSSRPTTDVGINLLVTEFLGNDFNSFSESAMIPVYVQPEDLDPTCTNKNLLLGASAPDLRLEESVDELCAAGGRHRQQAVLVARAKLKKKMLQLEKNIQQLESRTKMKGKGKQKTTSESESDLSENEDFKLSLHDVESRHKFRLELREVAQKFKSLAIWGVIVYDANKLREDVELATYLSRNKKHIQNVESEREKLHQILRIQNELRLKGNDYAVMKHARSYMSDMMLRRFLHDEDTLLPLLSLFRFDDHFHFSEPFTKSWVANTLQSIGGGFILTYIKYSLDLWNGIFTPKNIFDCSRSDEAWPKYRTAITTGDPIDKALQYFPSTIFDSLLGTEKSRNISALTSLVFHALDNFGRENFKPCYFAASESDQWKTVMEDYGHLLTTTIYDSVMEVDTSSEEVIKIKEGLKSKIEWLLLDHSSSHFFPLLPLVTPSVLLCMGQLFDRIPNALTEFISWVCPMALYSVEGHRDLEGPHDKAIAAIRTLQEDGDRIFILPHNINRAVKEFAFFPFRYISQFHQLESDLAEVNVPKRPLNISQGVTQIGLLFPTAIKNMSQVVPYMRFRTSKEGKNTFDRIESLEWWPLNQKTHHYDWQRPGVRNRKRDFRKYATVALVEMEVVGKYREELLKKSTAARFLRKTFKALLDPEAFARYVKYWPRMTSTRVRGWNYPDGIPLPENVVCEKATVNLELLDAKRQNNAEIVKTAKTFGEILTKLQNHPAAKATPYDSLIDDSMRKALDDLEKAASKNIMRLTLMKRVGELDDLDPHAEEYNIKEELPIKIPYMRATGWTELNSHASTTPPQNLYKRKRAVTASLSTDSESDTSTKRLKLNSDTTSDEDQD